MTLPRKRTERQPFFGGLYSSYCSFTVDSTMSSFTDIGFDPLDLFENEGYLDSLLYSEDTNDQASPIEEYQPLGNMTLYVFCFHPLLACLDTFQRFCSTLKYDPYHPEVYVSFVVCRLSFDYFSFVLLLSLFCIVRMRLLMS
jgi:hypothetical protein